MSKESQGQVVETGQQARQGYLDRPILVVLVISTALALVALGSVWLAS